MSNIKEQVVEELHKPTRKNFQRRRVIVKHSNDLIQADLVEMQPYARINKGYRYILVVINVFNKFVWAQPVKRKTSKDVTMAMKKILLAMVDVPNNLQTDLGKEFYNKDFKLLMQSFDINHYSTFSNLKASIVERVNRTLKNLMWKQFSIQGSYKWLTILPKIVEKYNNTMHSTIGMKPKEVNKDTSKQLLKSVYSHLKTIDPKANKFKIGDFVRVSKVRGVFTKGYTPNWSNEIFKIIQVKRTNPTTYILQDEKNNIIQGAFYTEELLKTNFPDVYLVEKVLKTKGDKVYIKWLGFDNTHNSWIKKSDIL